MSNRERGLLGWATAAVGAALLTPPLPMIGRLTNGIYLLWEVEPQDIHWQRFAMVILAFLATCLGAAFALHQHQE